MKFELPECVVWDWNGTIYDDARICQDITNDQLEVMGLERLDYETQEILFKHPVEQYYRDMGATFEPGEFEKLSEEFHREYGRRRREGKVKRDAIELLSWFKEHGVKQVVLSAYRESDLVTLIDEVELGDFFTARLGLSDCHAVSKVERGVKWLELEDIDPARTLLVGDTNHDFEAAEAMGVRVVLVPSGYQHKNLLIQTGAPVYDSLDSFKKEIS